MRGAAVAGVLAVLLLAGCAAPVTPVAPSAAPSASAPSAASVDAALARFRDAARRAVAEERDPGGMDFVRALEAAGYRRAQLQVTADRTSVGLDVPAVQFSALQDGSCLIGQFGDAGLTVLRADPVDGACLIGDTRDLG